MTTTIEEKGLLRDVLARETTILRELLGNMHEEQEAILRGDTEMLKAVMAGREPLMVTLFECRTKRLRAIQSLPFARALDGNLSEDVVDSLAEDGCPTSCEILSLRDQILAIIEKVKMQNERNRYLLQNKVYLTREMIRRIYPGEENATYSAKGTLGKTKVKTAVTVINREV